MHDVDKAGLRAIALLELIKGLLVLIIAVGLLQFRHYDLTQTALMIIHRLRLDPASKAAAYLVHGALRFKSTDLRLWAALAFAYSGVRFAEAVGLWLDRTWGSVIGAWSGALYLPFEAVELYRHPDWMRLLLILTNLAIVLFLVHHLRHRHRCRAARAIQGG
ncbi:MAG: DUF2127 domain-containing protein [Burkholderiales bacterium]|nr:DUF2127 domain-containing protein [Burkholderiales bacterium]